MTRVTDGRETIYGRVSELKSVEYRTYNKSNTYLWDYNPFGTPQVRETRVKSLPPSEFTPLIITASGNKAMSNESVLKYLENHGSLDGEKIACASDIAIHIPEVMLIKKLNGAITFDQQGRVAGFEASGNLVRYDTPEGVGSFKYSAQISYQYEPQGPVLTDVGVINADHRQKAAKFYKFAGPDGAELTYEGKLPSLPSPLLDIKLRVDFSGRDNSEKTYTIESVEAVSAQNRPGRFLNDAAQTIAAVDTENRGLTINQRSYSYSPDVMILTWDQPSNRWTARPHFNEQLKDAGRFYCVVDQSSNIIKLMIQQHDQYMP